VRYGGIRRVQMDSGLRRRPVAQVVLDLIGDGWAGLCRAPHCAALRIF